MEETLRRTTVIVDGQKISRFEVHDNEAMEDEVLEELVCTLIHDAKQFREHF